jgi:hypothetical protein
MNLKPLAVLALSLLSTPLAAQSYDPSTGESPLTLLAAPQDGVAYFQAKERAREHFQARRFAEAEPLLLQLARDYPRDAENWYLLGLTQTGLGKHAEAYTAYQKAGPLMGWDVQYWNGYRMAEAKLAQGDRRGALDQLRLMLNERHGFLRAALYTDPDWAALKTDPEFLELIGRPSTAGWTRTEGWVRDIDFLYNEVKRVNPEYRSRPFPAELVRRYEELKRNVPRLSDEEIFTGMNRMLAVLHQGHVVLWNAPGNRYLPLRLYAFPEGVFVMEADSAHRDLEGARVVAFGSMPADTALREVAKGRSTDGDMEFVWAAATLTETAVLKGIGATRGIDSVRLTVQKPGQAPRTVTLATRDSARAGRQDRMVAPPTVAAPMFLRNLAKTFWHQAVPEHDALYVQINNLRNAQDETLVAYGRRLWSVADSSGAKNMILDLRHNNGGTTQLYPELLRSIVAYSRVPGNQVWVLIGRRSYSATGNFVTDLERLADPVFVGEASGECCNLHGDAVYVELPYSGVKGELTAVRWQLSTPGDRRREISPEVPVQLTARAYFAGQDPALDAIYRIIDTRRAAVPSPPRR